MNSKLKKSLFVTLGIILMFGMMGCKTKPSNDNVSEDIYHRCNETSSGYMAEIESGFYYNYSGQLYYADRTNINQWVPVCNKPDCIHGRNSFGCYATINEEMMERDGKIYYYDGGEHSIMRVAEDGSQHQKVLSLPLSVFDIGANTTRAILCPNNFIMYYSYLTEEGLFKQAIANVDEDGNLIDLFSYEAEKTLPYLTMPAYAAGARGDFAIISDLLIEDGEDVWNVLFRMNDENNALERVNLPEEVSVLWSHLKGNTFTYYKKEEGFFEIDLELGKEELILKNQLQDGIGYVLTQDYMIETNRYIDHKPEEAYLKFYNSETWIDVQLPDIIKKSDYPFHPVSVASDRMFFIHFPHDNSGYQLYYFMLSEQNPTLTLCATFGDEGGFEDILSAGDNKVSSLQEVDVTVFDTEEYFVKVTEIGFDVEDQNEYLIKAYCENKTSDKTFKIYLNTLTINGVQVSLASAVTVRPKETLEHIAVSSKSMFRQRGVDCNKEFSNIQLLSYVLEEGKKTTYHPDTGTDFDTSLVSIYPYGEDKATIAVREPLSTDKIIIDNEYVKIAAIGYENWTVSDDEEEEIDEFGVVQCVIDNKTDKVLGVYLTLTSINNIPLNYYYTDFYQPVCLPESQQLNFISLWEDMLKNNNIEIGVIDEYEVILEISYADAWGGRIGKPLLEETITIKK